MLVQSETFTPAASLLLPFGGVPETEERPLLFDIETTGLSAERSHIYLIGCAYRCADGYTLHQWFAESSAEEFDVLEAFLSFCASCTRLISFNGASFDLPYLQAKCRDYLLDASALQKPMTDLYRLLSPCRKWLGLPRLRQIDVERFVGLSRDDPYTGRELIDVYRAYGRARRMHADDAKTMLRALLLHNAEDVKGMLACTNALAFLQPFDGSYTFVSGSADETEAIFSFRLHMPVVRPFEKQHKSGTLLLSGTEMTVRLPVYDGRLRFYHADYKQYVCDESEGLLLPKRLAASLGQTSAKPTTPENCWQYVPLTPTLLSDPSNAVRLCAAWLAWLRLFY